ncbi:MAG: AraC family transcriptional regulator ligand-binding domain-containing protein [Porticoccaceae bacterium]
MDKDAFSSVRPTKLLFYLRCMEKFGYKTEDVLEGTELNKTKLKDPYLLVEVSDYIRTVSNMLRLTNCQELPFRMGRELVPGDLGILGHAVSSCENTEEGVDVWRKYNRLFFGNLFAFSETVKDGRQFHEFTPRVKLLPHLVQFFIEEKITVDFTLFKKFNNCQVRCRYYGLTYPAPPHKKRYEEVIGIPATFNAEKILYVVDLEDEWMMRPFLWADSETARICKSYLEEIASVAGCRTTVTAKTKHLIQENLPRILSIDEMAEYFSCSARTFCRYLAVENSRYQDLIASVRTETAKNFLSTTSIPVDRIADHLGFSDTGSLRRSFKLWTGMTISEYKKSSRLSAIGN